jgi:hypothetical protein
VASTVAAVQGGIFTINEARAKFDLPPMAEGDTTLVTPGAEKVGTDKEEPDEENGTEAD